VTFPAGASDPIFNLVVRGLAFRSGHLLVSQWVGGYCFPIGGRLQHGESLEAGVRREFLEETGVAPTVRQMVYFHENFFRDTAGRPVHELGWYFWVEAPDVPGALDEIRPHPDHPDLRLAYVPLDRLGEVALLPHFLVEALPRDYRAGFPGSLRCFETREP
jgi:ADP-ribose pyrophosphatase YjhB (NUDIX family)